MMNVIWIVAVAVFAVTEALTTGLVSVWFAVGGAAALIASVLGARVVTQLWTFVLVSAAALAVTRPVLRRFTPLKMTPTNADRVLGSVGTVRETVDGTAGTVYADGKIWSARSADGEVIPPQSQVRVERLEGVKLFVRKCEQEVMS